MRILFLTQVLPYPLDAGPKTRAYYVLCSLLDAGHQVTLVSFTRTSDTQTALAHLRELCTAVETVPIQRSILQEGWALLSSLISGQPLLITRDRRRAMRALIRRVCAEQTIDAVHADQLWMAPYALMAADQQSARHNVRPLTVLDQHNAVFQIPARLAQNESNRLRRALLVREAAKMARYETAMCQRFDRVVWVTAEDRALLQRPDDRIIPICVDPAVQPPITPHQVCRRVTFLGGLHWPPNAAGVVWFVNEVWPLVVAHGRDAILTVMGKDPPAALQQAEDAASNIEITGYVDDPLPYLAETAVFIVPLHAGGGMRVKILDAWQWGLPVVSTTIGAEGIDGVNGESILIGDTPETFAHAIVRLLATPELNQRLRTGGRQLVETTYNWRIAYQQWAEIYG